MTQQIQIYNRITDPVGAALQLGSSFARSGLFGCEKTETGTMLALACFAENKSPFEILRTYDIVDSKLRKKALAIHAEFRQRGGKVKWINSGKDGLKAEAEFSFEGQTLVESFTLEDAKKQNTVRPNSNWIKTPANMLRARVLSNAIGMLCPEIVAGADDVIDIQSESIEPGKPLFQEKAPTNSTLVIDRSRKDRARSD